MANDVWDDELIIERITIAIYPNDHIDLQQSHILIHRQAITKQPGYIAAAGRGMKAQS